MANIRIANRYANSLFQFAAIKDLKKEVLGDMHDVLAVLKDSSELQNVLNSPIIAGEKKKAIISKVFSSLKPETMKFLNLLIEKRREGNLIEITEKFIEMNDEFEGKYTIEVTSAVALTQESTAKVERYSKSVLGLDNVKIISKVDPKIIGGMIIKHKDKLLDMSISKELREIRKKLIYN